MSLEDIKADIKAIVAEKNCGPIFIRLSWHDAGVYSSGKLTGGKFIKKILCTWLIKKKSEFAFATAVLHISTQDILLQVASVREGG